MQIQNRYLWARKPSQLLQISQTIYLRPLVYFITQILHNFT